MIRCFIQFILFGLNVCIFFFKQKTAYEMRISDWSSDVCSSDLFRDKNALSPAGRGPERATPYGRRIPRRTDLQRLQRRVDLHSRRHGARAEQIGRATSELQSLMRISYAVFCLKKKKTKHMNK